MRFSVNMKTIIKFCFVHNREQKYWFYTNIDYLLIIFFSKKQYVTEKKILKKLVECPSQTMLRVGMHLHYQIF